MKMAASHDHVEVSKYYWFNVHAVKSLRQPKGSNTYNQDLAVSLGVCRRTHVYAQEPTGATTYQREFWFVLVILPRNVFPVMNICSKAVRPSFLYSLREIFFL